MGGTSKKQYQRNRDAFLRSSRFKKLDGEEQKKVLGRYYDKYTVPYLKSIGKADKIEAHRGRFVKKYGTHQEQTPTTNSQEAPPVPNEPIIEAQAPPIQIAPMGNDTPIQDERLTQDPPTDQSYVPPTTGIADTDSFGQRIKDEELKQQVDKEVQTELGGADDKVGELRRLRKAAADEGDWVKVNRYDRNLKSSYKDPNYMMQRNVGNLNKLAEEIGMDAKTYASSTIGKRLQSRYLSEEDQKEFELLNQIEELDIDLKRPVASFESHEDRADLQLQRQELTDQYKAYKQAEYKGIDSQIRQLREELRAGYRTTMTQGTPIRQKISVEERQSISQKIKDLSAKKQDRFFKKDYKADAEAIISDNGDELSAMEQQGLFPKDATPQEKMSIYFNALDMEYDELMEGYDGSLKADYGRVIRKLTPEEQRIKDVRKKLEQLAPIVLLNKADTKGKDGFWKAFGTSYLKFLNPNLQKQQSSGLEKAQGVEHTLRLLGVPDEATTAAAKGSIEQYRTESGRLDTKLTDAEFWGQTVGTSTALMTEMAVGGAVLNGIKGLKLPKVLSKVFNAKKGQETAIATKKASDAALKSSKLQKLIGGAVESGLQYEISGQIFKNNHDELNFVSGLFGFGGEKLVGKVYDKTLVKLLPRIFGKSTEKAVKAMTKWVGRGVGETAEEMSQTLVQLAQSENGFTSEFMKQFPDAEAATKFFVSTMAMGMLFGVGGAIGQGVNEDAKRQYEAITDPQQRKIADAAIRSVGDAVQDMSKEAAKASGWETGVETEVGKTMQPISEEKKAEILKRRKETGNQEQVPTNNENELTVSQNKEAPLFTPLPDEGGISAYSPRKKSKRAFEEQIGFIEGSYKKAIEAGNIEKAQKLELAKRQVQREYEEAKQARTKKQAATKAANKAKKLDKEVTDIVTTNLSKVPTDVSQAANTGEAMDMVANESTNPLEIVEYWNDTDAMSVDEDFSIEGIIAQEIGKIQKADFDRWGDPNTVKDTPGMGLHWFSKDAQPLDDQAQQIAEKYNKDVSEVLNAIVDFVGKYSGGASTYKVDNPQRSQLENRFEELTGKKLTPELATALINKQFEQLEQAQQIEDTHLVQEFETMQEAEEAYYQAMVAADTSQPVVQKKETITKPKITDNATNQTGDEQVSDTQETINGTEKSSLDESQKEVREPTAEVVQKKTTKNEKPKVQKNVQPKERDGNRDFPTKNKRTTNSNADTSDAIQGSSHEKILDAIVKIPSGTKPPISLAKQINALKGAEKQQVMAAYKQKLAAYQKQQKELQKAGKKAAGEKVVNNPKENKSAKEETQETTKITTLNAGKRNRDQGRIQAVSEPKPKGWAKKLHEIFLETGHKFAAKINYAKQGGRRGAAGTYSASSTGVTLRYTGDLDTLAHEIGHWLDDKFGIGKDFSVAFRTTILSELKRNFIKYGSKPPAVLKGKKNKAAREAYETAEGIAEWIRAYLVNPIEAKRRAPHFYNHYVATVDAETRLKIDSFGKDIRIWQGLPNFEKALTNYIEDPAEIKEIQMLYGQPDGSFGVTAADKAEFHLVDDMGIAEKAFNFARKIAGQAANKILPKDDFRIMHRLFTTVHNKFDYMFTQGMTDAKGNDLTDNGKRMNFAWLIKPFSDIATTAKEIKELQTQTALFMLAERTIELGKRWDRQSIISGMGAGIISDIQVAQGIVDDLVAMKTSDPARYAMIKEAARRYRLLADKTMRYMVDSGRMSEEQYKTIKEQNQYYVAMNRMMQAAPDEEIAVFKGSGNGASLGSVAEPINKIKGSTRPIVNPYLSLYDTMYKVVKESDRNVVMQDFVAPLRSNRGLHEANRRELAKVGQQVTSNGDNTITVFNKGKKEYWLLHADVYKSLKGLIESPYRVPLVLTMMAKTVRATVTNFPVFMFNNFRRDLINRVIISDVGSKITDVTANADTLNDLDKHGASQAAFYAVMEKEGMGAGQWLKPKNLQKAYKIAKESEGSSLRAFFRAVQNGANLPDYLNHYQGYYNKMDKEMRKIVAAKDGTILVNPLKWAAKGAAAYQKLARLSEAVNRAAEYKVAFKKAKAQGMDDYNAGLYAAYKAKDLMDFYRAGHSIRVINQMIPFTNAAIQGLRKTYIAATTHTGDFATRMLIYSVMPSVATLFFNAAIGDDELEEYRQLPQYRRDMFWNFKLYPGMEGWFTIPKPFELGVIGSTFERSADLLLMGNDKAFEEHWKSYISAFSPLDEGQVISGFFAPIMEAKANWSFFRNKTIVSPHENNLKLDHPSRHSERGSRIGQALQEVVGADARKIDHVIKGTFTYFGNFAIKVSDIGRKDKQQLGWGDTGIFKNDEVYGARDVKWVMQQSKLEGWMSKKEYQNLVKTLGKYFDATTKESRQEEGKKTRDLATKIRAVWEARQKKIKAQKKK